MICYQLRCSRGHGFEGWFRNSAAYADEVARLACPLCGDADIEKAIMAPAVLQRGGPPDAAAPAATDAAGVDLPGVSAENTGEGTAAASSATASPGPSNQRAGISRTPPEPGGPRGAPNPRELARVLTAMRALKAHVEANFENVGRRFAEEARKIHHEEAAPRGIYGQATADEVTTLEEEGVAIEPLPNLPKLDS